ncbi:similar to Saccharomyces cerevisiae YMR236W TAF9 Subunit (17 kDa) of TFIID and SAGA complexes [Maudiozyma barnettii]|uniref:Similar to Saccharomyces cerevisiae YMR236W TAF9 Subunit (17 kDa) of TFIID and SAGA complexes n=1 Tax=Maudiozyma barnettii TaxID=61262 RepID=A0A8H2ZGD7_9SACH|nr:chromatin modification protein [Kazachstania barnettii]CAB4252665.1 similar to Saccharomyces cerevisiae YMR236W TAF9 Subunit (17 kDa) of TFIID and SAGA complexes [Kazachstania barnettii]CAD1780455.1 similar to Saccharomyces cerevisiae YMR236W TAF9 Subunit (17 kDa) of TFIID and SAGA complexes [Kazachstania barnettii]
MTTSAASATTSASSAAPAGIDTTPQEDTPRDVRLLHLLLASQAIHQYEDQVPLQLMDFAYRYTRGVLKDAMMYNDYMGANLHVENNSSTNTTTATTTTSTNNNNNNASSASNDGNDTQGHDSGKKGKKGLTVEDIRLAIAARTQYQFKPTAPKELMLQLAADRNKKALPQVMGSWGIRLPPEKYCLTAKEWDNDDNHSSSN